MQVMQKMQSNDLLKSNENNEDNAKVTAYMNATIIIPSVPFPYLLQETAFPMRS
jgi:hypothetical protein